MEYVAHMKSRGAVNLHKAVTMSQHHLGNRVAQLTSARMSEVGAALSLSLGVIRNQLPRNVLPGQGTCKEALMKVRSVAKLKEQEISS